MLKNEYAFKLTLVFLVVRLLDGFHLRGQSSGSISIRRRDGRPAPYLSTIEPIKRINYCRRPSYLARYIDDKSATWYRKVVIFHYVKSHVYSLLFATRRVTKKIWLKTNIFIFLNISMSLILSCFKQEIFKIYLSRISWYTFKSISRNSRNIFK